MGIYSVCVFLEIKGPPGCEWRRDREGCGWESPPGATEKSTEGRWREGWGQRGRGDREAAQSPGACRLRGGAGSPDHGSDTASRRGFGPACPPARSWDAGGGRRLPHGPVPAGRGGGGVYMQPPCPSAAPHGAAAGGVGAGVCVEARSENRVLRVPPGWSCTAVCSAVCHTPSWSRTWGPHCTGSLMLRQRSAHSWPGLHRLPLEAGSVGANSPLFAGPGASELSEVHGGAGGHQLWHRGPRAHAAPDRAR